MHQHIGPETEKTHRSVKLSENEQGKSRRWSPWGIRKLCDMLVQWVGVSLSVGLRWVSWPPRPLGRKANFQPQKLLRARQGPGICITCGEVWCKQDHHDHPGTAHWELDHKAGGENLRRNPILLNSWEKEIFPDFSVKK